MFTANDLLPRQAAPIDRTPFAAASVGRGGVNASVSWADLAAGKPFDGVLPDFLPIL